MDERWGLAPLLKIYFFGSQIKINCETASLEPSRLWDVDRAAA